MPPRWLSTAILLAWAASAVWLFRVEIWPTLEPNAPPPFTIDLVDEAQTKTIIWHVKQNDEEVIRAETFTKHRSREDDFILHARFKLRTGAKVEGLPAQLESMESEYRVTPEGRLLGLDVKLQVRVPPLPLLEAHLWGDVHEGQFAPHYEVNVPLLGKRLTGDLRPVAVSSQGSVVMPLHPVNRISGLRPGQTWRVPIFDPLADSLASMTGSEARMRFLRAKVRPQLETLSWNGTATTCLVIDYHEENDYAENKIDAETWVREADGLVLRQVAESPGEKWEMDRETP